MDIYKIFTTEAEKRKKSGFYWKTKKEDRCYSFKLGYLGNIQRSLFSYILES